MTQTPATIFYTTDKEIYLEFIIDGMISYEVLPIDLYCEEVVSLANVYGGSSVLVSKINNIIIKIEKLSKKSISAKEVRESFDFLEKKF